jgi:hypothetical protein
MPEIVQCGARARTDAIADNHAAMMRAVELALSPGYPSERNFERQNEAQSGGPHKI